MHKNLSFSAFVILVALSYFTMPISIHPLSFIEKVEATVHTDANNQKSAINRRSRRLNKSKALSSSSSAYSSPSITTIMPTGHSCTAQKWICQEWKACNKGIQTRKCEINYKVDQDCLNPETSKPPESQTCIVSQDSNYDSMLASYNNYTTGFDNMLKIAKTYENSTMLVLKEILQGYVEDLGNYGTYVGFASKRQLSDDEYLAAGNAVSTLNSAIERFRTVTESANSATQASNKAQEVKNQYQQAQLEVACTQLKNSTSTKLGASGGGSDSSGLKWQQDTLFQAGCLSTQQYCNGLSKIQQAFHMTSGVVPSFCH